MTTGRVECSPVARKTGLLDPGPKHYAMYDHTLRKGEFWTTAIRSQKRHLGQLCPEWHWPRDPSADCSGRRQIVGS
ncbi:hypothetical protein VTN96DRAFT_2299 [Rasamsonia emersonii]